MNLLLKNPRSHFSQFTDSYTILVNKISTWENITFIKNSLFYSGLQNLKVTYQEELLI